MSNLRHANLTLNDDRLDELHALKRRLARQRGERLTLEDMLREAIDLLLAHHRVAAAEAEVVK